MIDLHIHSSLSDGTDSPKEIIELINIKGIKTFSITDHDNIEAHKQIECQYMELIKEYGLNYISGVEFSTDYHGRTMHILVYGYNSKDEFINLVVEHIHALRIERFSRRIEDLSTYFSINFTQEELEWLYSRNNPGKPHIARLLVKNGYAKDMSEAFAKFMPEKLGNYKVDAVELVKRLSSHGYLVGIAHPLGGEGEQRISISRFESNVQELVKYGIKFLECYYCLYNEKEREIIKMVADKYGLLVSGGSDYHGINKDIELGDLGVDYDPDIQDLTILKKF